MEKIDPPVFLDLTKKRWGKIKRSLSVFVLILLSLAGFVAYSYYYSPFEIPVVKGAEVSSAIDEINAKQRNVRGNGTFFRLYGKPGEEHLEKISNQEKIVVLSFDDGPDPKYTRQILDVLRKENVKGTFFATGEQIYRNHEIGDEILRQGSDIGLHTFTHYENAEDVKLNPITFLFELDFSEKIFAYHYGYKSKIFRVPFLGEEENPSYNALQYIGEGLKRDMSVSAPTVDSFDWRHKDPKKIIDNATDDSINNAVILFHDAGGDRSSTVQVLPEVIKYYRDRGYKFMTISEMAKEFGLPYRAELTVEDRILSFGAFTAYDIYRKTPGVLRKGFLAGFAFVLLHSVLFIVLAICQLVKNKIASRKAKKYRRRGLVSVVIPMYNEERSIAPAIASVLKTRTRKMEVIVVDDGCTDTSFEKVSPFLRDSRLKIISTQKNYGKYRALNRGVEEAKGRIVVFIDADTRVMPDSINKLVRHFTDIKIAGVAGNIMVGNKSEVLTELQNIEYCSAQGIDKRALDLFGSVTVVPGAFGAWRTGVIRKIGGFSHKTQAEDFDLTMEVLRRGYKVKFADDALARTEAPTNIKDLMTQRLRWSFGNLQVLFKNKSMIFNPKYGILGMFFLPRSVLVQIPSMLAAPLFDIFAVLSFFLWDKQITLIFLLLYFLLQLFMTHAAFLLINKNFARPQYIFLMRFPYTHIMFASLFIAVAKAIKGDFLAWKKLRHTGKLSLSPEYGRIKSA